MNRIVVSVLILSIAVVGCARQPAMTQSAAPSPTGTATTSVIATPTSTGIPNGGTCTDAALCQSRNCVDDVCCDTPCRGPLERCDVPGFVGTCHSTATKMPATSRRGLIVALLLLTGIAALTIARQRRRR